MMSAARPIRHEPHGSLLLGDRRPRLKPDRRRFWARAMPTPMRIAVSSLLATANAQILYQREDAPQSMEEQMQRLS